MSSLSLVGCHSWHAVAGSTSHSSLNNPVWSDPEATVEQLLEACDLTYRGKITHFTLDTWVKKGRGATMKRVKTIGLDGKDLRKPGQKAPCLQLHHRGQPVVGIEQKWVAVCVVKNYSPTTRSIGTSPHASRLPTRTG